MDAVTGQPQRDAERRAAQEDEDALDLVDYARVSERIMSECDRYGLPYGDPLESLEGLLRHIYANQSATNDAWRFAVKTLKARTSPLEFLATLQGEADKHGFHHGTKTREGVGWVDDRSSVAKALRAMADA